MSPGSRTPRSIGLLVVAVFLGILLIHGRRSNSAVTPTTEAGGCDGLTDPRCASDALDAEVVSRTGNDPGPMLSADDVCAGSGYLCSGLQENAEPRVLRWPDDTPLLRVWIPAPEGVSPAEALALQRAAARGIQTWSNHPFPLTISTRSIADNPDVTIRWVPSLGANRLGQARMEWRRQGEEIHVRIPGLALVTHQPQQPSRTIGADVIELVAAHEMGHALGLPHSDDQRDLMYPQNTARHPSQRDYRTMEALYRIPNGALIRP